MMTNVVSEIAYQGRGLSRAVIQAFTPYVDQLGRIAFYPSSGAYIKQVLSLPYDTFFFADYQFKPSLSHIGKRANNQLLSRLVQQGIEVHESTDQFIFGKKIDKKIFYFFIDNNEVLQLIRHSIGRLHGFIGVRDGCIEGGNYECVNNYPFLEKVVQLSGTEGMDIFIDHSAFLSHYPQYIFGKRIIRFVSESKVKLNKYPIGKIKVYSVTPHQPVVHSWMNNTVKLSIEWDSILNHDTQLDGIVCSPLCRKLAHSNYFIQNKKYAVQPPYFFRPNLCPDWTANESLSRVLALSREHNWSSIGVTAFGEGKHTDFLEILKHWETDRPVWIRLFHLQEEDFAELKLQIAAESSSIT